MKTFRAVVFLDTKQFKQLSDEDVDVSVPGHGDWGLAASDKAYRGQQWLSPNPRDYALLNVRTELHRVSGRGHDQVLAQFADEISAALHVGDRFDLSTWKALPAA